MVHSCVHGGGSKLLCVFNCADGSRVNGWCARVYMHVRGASGRVGEMRVQ